MPITFLNNFLNIGYLITDFRNICRCETVWLSAERYIPITFLVKSHHTIKPRSRKEHKVKGTMFEIESIFDFSVVSITIFISCF